MASNEDTYQLLIVANCYLIVSLSPGLPPKAATAQGQLTRTRSAWAGRGHCSELLTTSWAPGKDMGIETLSVSTYMIQSSPSFGMNLDLIFPIVCARNQHQPAANQVTISHHIWHHKTFKYSQYITHTWCHRLLSRDISQWYHTLMISYYMSREIGHDVICDIDLPVSWVMWCFQIYMMSCMTSCWFDNITWPGTW